MFSTVWHLKTWLLWQNMPLTMNIRSKTNTKWGHTKIIPLIFRLRHVGLDHVLPLQLAHVVHHLVVKVRIVESFISSRYWSGYQNLVIRSNYLNKLTCSMSILEELTLLCPWTEQRSSERRKLMEEQKMILSILLYPDQEHVWGQKMTGGLWLVGGMIWLPQWCSGSKT